MIVPRERVPVEVGGRQLLLSSLDKVLWPATGFTKGQLIAYVRAVAPILIPHLAGRPLTLGRWPDGVDAEGWFQTNCRGAPDWLPLAVVRGKKGQVLRYALVNDEPSLVWIANLGTVERHPFNATHEEPAEPLALVIDLDPGPPAGVLDAARVALRVRELLVEKGLRSYARTSGQKGIHVYAPLAPRHSFRHVKALARELARALAREDPARITDRIPRAERAGRVYVDWAQNDAGRSMVAPYSLRAAPWPLVSAPVAWDELASAVALEKPGPLLFRPEEVLRRVRERGDLFAGVLVRGQGL